MADLTLRLHKMIDARDKILNNEKAMFFFNQVWPMMIQFIFNTTFILLITC